MDTPSWVDQDLWPYPPRWADLPEGRQHFVDVGAGPPVLFVHGTPTWSIDWRGLIGPLAADHRCIAVDHLGFGLSERPEGAGYAPEDHARRFATFADALDLRDATLVVHDFGGVIALPWAARNPDRIRRLVLLNTWGFPFEGAAARWGARVLGSAVGRWLYRWANLSLRVIAPSAWADRRRLSPDVYRQWLAPFEDRGARVQVLWTLARSLLASEAFFGEVERALPRLAGLPVDLLWGLKDPACPPAMLERWQRIFPQARVTRLADSGHWPHEEATAEVLAALRLAPQSQPD